MRVGAIDVGTNSVHLMVADVAPDGTITPVEKAREQVELGAGGLARQRLEPDAMERGLAALTNFRHACDALKVDDIHAAATSAVREAENGVEFCRAVRDQTGIHLRIISGTEEGRLIYLGARPHLDFSGGRVMLFDLGGGSTEFIVCDAEQSLITLSIPAGHIRLAELHGATEQLTEEKYQALKQEIRNRLRPLRARIHPEDFASIVGTSGTLRCLARMATHRRGDQRPEHGHGLVLYRSEIDTLVRMARHHPDRFNRLPGMDGRRRRTLPAGAVLVREVLKAFGANAVLTSEHALRDGLVSDWILRNRPEIDLSRTVPDPRRRSVLAAMKRYGASDQHAHSVAQHALQLFDGTFALHQMRIDDRRMLEFAALLHDVGHHIAGKDHHLHGQYLIRHTRMSGFTAPEIAMLAALVRYHRGGRPKQSQTTFSSFSPSEQRKVRILAGLLRLADALDRGHDQVVDSLTVQTSDTAINIRVSARGAAHLERWAAKQRSVLLATALERDVEVEIVQQETV